MLNGEISHDKITRLLSGQDYTSKSLWHQLGMNQPMFKRKRAIK